MGLFDRLIDDAVLLMPDEPPLVEAAVEAHRAYRAAWFGHLIGPLVVPDHRLAGVGRAAGDAPVAVTVVNTGGAGGLVALARRSVPGVEVLAVESALRDLDDLAGNAARVAAAAGELDDDVSVFIEIPYGPGWAHAVETVEAAGLLGMIRADGTEAGASPERLGEQLSTLVEADLPFTVAIGSAGALPQPDAAPGGPRGQAVLSMILALAALIDGAQPAEAAELLRLDQPDRIAETVGGWDEAAAARVRHRLRSVSCNRAGSLIGELESVRLISGA